MLTRGADTRRIPFLVVVDHPVLAKSTRHPARAAGRPRGHDAGAPSRVAATATRPAATRAIPGPEVVYRVKITEHVANFGAVTLSGHAVPHVVFAGDENHLVRLRRPPDDAQPVLRDASATRARSPARSCRCRARTTSSSTRAAKSRRRAVHVPLLGERHDAARAPPRARAIRARSPSRSPTPARASIRARSTATVDGHDVRVRYADGKAVVRADPGKHTVVVPGLRLPGGEEHGGRREDQAEHGDAHAHRRRPLGDALPAPLGVLLVDRRQRREVALDRPRELLGVRRDDLQLLLAARAIALTASVLAEAARDPRPLGTRHERHSRDEQDDGEDTHEPKDSRERATPSSPPRLAHSKRAAATRASSALVGRRAGRLRRRRRRHGDDDAPPRRPRRPPTAKAGRDRLPGVLLPDGALVPVTVIVPPTKAVARAALEQLLAGPAGRLRHGDPGRRRARGRGDRGRHRDRELLGEARHPTRTAQGQIVCTLDAVPDGARRRGSRSTAKPVAAPERRRRRPHAAGDERRLRRPDPGRASSSSARRRGTPPSRARSTSPGTATVFEATLAVEIWQGGKLVGHEDDHGQRRRPRARHVVDDARRSRRAT